MQIYEILKTKFNIVNLLKNIIIKIFQHIFLDN